MSNPNFKIALCVTISFLSQNIIYTQIFEKERAHPYQKVFVDTDDFDDHYLELLEETYPLVSNDSIRFSMLNDLSYFWHTRNLTKALEFTNSALSEVKEKGNTLWQGRMEITLGAILLRMEELDEAERVLESAKSKVIDKDLPLLYTQLGYVYERRGQLDKAAEYALEALSVGEQLKDHKAIAMAYSDLSNLFWKQSKFESGLEYGIKSLEQFKLWGLKDLDYDFTLYVVGNNYLALKDYENAKKLYEESIEVGLTYGFYNNLSDVYISLVELYAFMGQTEDAAIAGENALKYATLLENEFMMMRSLLAVGKLDFIKGDFTASITNIQQCIKIATDEFGDAYYLSQAYETLGKAHAANGHYQEAYSAFKVYDSLKSKVFTEKADERISELKAEMDLVAKEGTIKLQEVKINEQRNFQTLLIVIAVLLLILLLLAYKAIRNKFRINSLLQKQNKEKEFLLKEIHHRVKNNLEIVSSLLSLQSAQINDPNVLNAMQDSQHRVQSMSMIHKKLYLGENLATIEMKDYFLNLGNYILYAYGVEKEIALEVDMDAIELDVDMAVPIGLIVNELISNSIKHAFPNHSSGKIYLSLRNTDNILKLDVIDDGIGQGEFKNPDSVGFGTNLISLLTKQLDGKMNLKTNEGTSVSFLFQNTKAA
ncbi:MAG: histidine kinase dimerization/phosphoacceptor domain -containing protein [Maribacter sp.]